MHQALDGENEATYLKLVDHDMQTPSKSKMKTKQYSVFELVLLNYYFGFSAVVTTTILEVLI